MLQMSFIFLCNFLGSDCHDTPNSDTLKITNKNHQYSQKFLKLYLPLNSYFV